MLHYVTKSEVELPRWNNKYTEHDLRNFAKNLGADISCRRCGQAIEIAKHILSECENVDIRRRMIFYGWV